MKKTNLKKTNVKKTKKYTTDEVKRYMKILAEDFEVKVKVIAEQYLNIKKTLDQHTKILDSHSAILASHTETLEIMKIDIQFIKNSLKEKEKVDLQEFKALERRVALLEAKIRVLK
ncbi:MAG: hypothetical protein N2259_02470 [Patescibacteria group bacterium]|nr:hypothetical protein [Patescibacteria group bacterium]